MKRYKVKRRDYPTFCPKCGSKNIEFFGLEASGDLLEDAIECKNCDFTWSIRYKYQKWSPTGKYAEYPSNADKEVKD